MYINEYGDKCSPTIILLAPIMISEEDIYALMLPHFKGEYHIIAPDQGGRGRAGVYISADEELIAITKELADTLRKNRTIDWQKRDSARAKMRMMIKKLLKKHRYPPEGMDDAVRTVMTQCELWTDNADTEQREQKVVNYSFRSEQNLGTVAEEPAPYGKNNSWR